MKFYKDIYFFYLFLTDWFQTRRKNTIEITTTFYGFSQTDVLINSFIPLRGAELITWEIFVQEKRNLVSTKEGSRLAGMKVV